MILNYTSSESAVHSILTCHGKRGQNLRERNIVKITRHKPTSKELNDEIEKSQVGTTYGNIVSSKLTNLLNITRHATEELSLLSSLFKRSTCFSDQITLKYVPL